MLSIWQRTGKGLLLLLLLVLLLSPHHLRWLVQVLLRLCIRLQRMLRARCRLISSQARPGRNCWLHTAVHPAWLRQAGVAWAQRGIGAGICRQSLRLLEVRRRRHRLLLMRRRLLLAWLSQWLRGCRGQMRHRRRRRCGRLGGWARVSLVALGSAVWSSRSVGAVSIQLPLVAGAGGLLRLLRHLHALIIIIIIIIIIHLHQLSGWRLLQVLRHLCCRLLPLEHLLLLLVLLLLLNLVVELLLSLSLGLGHLLVLLLLGLLFLLSHRPVMLLVVLPLLLPLLRPGLPQ